MELDLVECWRLTESFSPYSLTAFQDSLYLLPLPVDSLCLFVLRYLSTSHPEKKKKKPTTSIPKSTKSNLLSKQRNIRVENPILSNIGYQIYEKQYEEIQPKLNWAQGGGQRRRGLHEYSYFYQNIV